MLSSFCADVTGLDNNEYLVARSQDPKIRLADAWFWDLSRYDIVFHCAAYKHVSLAKDNRMMFFENNVSLVTYMLSECRRYGVDFTLCSTDKVSGHTFMGWTKKKAEEAVTVYDQKALRLVNCVGSRGSVIDIWDSGGPYFLCDPDVKRYWMNVRDAAYALALTAVFDNGVYTVDGVPCLSMGEIAQAWSATRQKVVSFLAYEMDEKEAKEEALIAKDEMMVSTVWPFIKKVERGI